MSIRFIRTSYVNLILGLLTILYLPGCYEDEVTFTPDLTSQENISEFLNPLLDVSEYYQFSAGENTEFIPLDNGWWLEIPTHSLSDQNNKVIQTGFIDLKVNILGTHTSDFLYAPSLESDRNLLWTDYCISLEFSVDRVPLKLNQPMHIYLPLNEDGLVSSLKIFGYDSTSSGYQWSQILNESTATERGTWKVLPDFSISGLKLTTLNEEKWMALARKSEEGILFENKILLTTDKNLTDKNSLVFFIPQEGHNAVRLDYDSNFGTFYKDFRSAELSTQGHIIILSDSGNSQYSFGMKKIEATDQSSGLHIKTESKTLEEIKRALRSL
jgi:hypothetical protein